MNNMVEKVKAWVNENPRRAMITGAAVVIFIIGFFIDVPAPHVALGGEPISSTLPSWLTNAVLMTIIVDIVLVVLALLATSRMKEIPAGIQNVMEFAVEALYNLAEGVAGKNAAKFFPWAATIFFLIITANWLGLIPGVGSIGYIVGHSTEEHAPVEGEEPAPTDSSHGFNWDGQLAMAGGSLILAAPESAVAAPAAATEGEHYIPYLRAPSADLNFTFALAIATMVMVQVWGVRMQGGAYFRKFFNFSGPTGFMKGINGFVGILELISEVSRILSFGFRLFGNIFAGEVVLATMAFLVTFFIPMPFYLLEVFVGFVQALVFMMLTLVFFHMATLGHGGDGHHEEHH
jgi:F-type H+-transporting ATPase subunit a